MRGGQVYYLLGSAIERARRPGLNEARIGIGHGQMREQELEQVMSAFYHKHDVLVCTTIIETGIDIPNANTIIMDRADKFGWPRSISFAAAWVARTTRRTRIC